MAQTSAPRRKSHDFLLRRLHSLTGIIPIGGFLAVHLATNAMILQVDEHRDHFQEQVDRIHALGPFLLPVEIMFIFAPILFHAGLGIKIWLEGKSNTTEYPYMGNVRYTLQRATGLIALVFISIHVVHLHWIGEPFGAGFFRPAEAAVSASSALQAHRAWALPVYAVGISAACFHLANGLWTFAITWGIVVGKNAQRKFGYACAVLGVALACTGLAALGGFMLFDTDTYMEAPGPNPESGGSSDLSSVDRRTHLF